MEGRCYNQPFRLSPHAPNQDKSQPRRRPLRKAAHQSPMTIYLDSPAGDVQSDRHERQQGADLAFRDRPRRQPVHHRPAGIHVRRVSVAARGPGGPHHRPHRRTLANGAGLVRHDARAAAARHVDHHAGAFFLGGAAWFRQYLLSCLLPQPDRLPRQRTRPDQQLRHLQPGRGDSGHAGPRGGRLFGRPCRLFGCLPGVGHRRRAAGYRPLVFTAGLFRPR